MILALRLVVGLVSRASTAFVNVVGSPRIDDDEHHLVFECAVFAVFEPLRREMRHLFGREVAFDMRRFFAHRDQFGVVVYVLACLRYIASSAHSTPLPPCLPVPQLSQTTPTLLCHLRSRPRGAGT